MNEFIIFLSRKHVVWAHELSYLGSFSACMLIVVSRKHVFLPWPLVEIAMSKARTLFFRLFAGICFRRFAQPFLSGHFSAISADLGLLGARLRASADFRPRPRPIWGPFWPF